MGKVILLPSKMKAALTDFSEDLLLFCLPALARLDPELGGTSLVLLKYVQLCRCTSSQVFALLLTRMFGFALGSSGFYFLAEL